MAKEAEELARQAERIRRLREEKAHREGRRVPQPEVADAVGVTLRTYQLWEAGDSDPEPQNLKALAAFFKVSPDFIEYGPEGRKTPDLFAGDSPSQLDRIESRLDEIYALLTGGPADSEDPGLAGLADRVLSADESPPRKAGGRSATRPGARRRNVA